MQVPSLRDLYSLQTLRSLFTEAVILVPEVVEEVLWTFCDPLLVLLSEMGRVVINQYFPKKT